MELEAGIRDNTPDGSPWQTWEPTGLFYLRTRRGRRIWVPRWVLRVLVGIVRLWNGGR